MKNEILSLRDFSVSIGIKKYSVVWPKDSYVIGCSSGFYAFRKIMEGIADSNLDLYSVFSSQVDNLSIEVLNVTLETSYVWCVEFDSGGIQNETIEIKSDGEVLSKYRVSRADEFPEVCGSLGEDEVSLSELSGNIRSSLENFKPLLLRSTGVGQKMVDFFSKIIYLGPSYFLRCDEESLKVLCEKLDTLLYLEPGASLERMRKVAPTCGFDVDHITEEGLAIINNSKTTFNGFDLKEMGSGYGQLAIFLAVFESTLQNNRIIIVDNLFESIHPLLKKALLSACIENSECNIGQILTSPVVF